MKESKVPYSILNNSTKMPWVGFGTWRLHDGEETYQAVRYAIDSGYSSFDTAMIYGNEKSLGRAIKDSGIPRDQLFITTKLWNEDIRKQNALKAIDHSLENLQLDYVDLYLVHWAIEGRYITVWNDMEEIYHSGKAKAIGVSNYMIEHLENLLTDAQITPAVNQVEFHPRLQQPSLQNFCKDHKIQLEAWSPLMKGRTLDHPIIQKIAKKHQKTPAQVLIRWDFQKEVITIPKSGNQKHIIENIDVFDFELDANDMKDIKSMDKNKRVGEDPYHVNF